MNKSEFLQTLRGELFSVPEADVKRSLEFYGEMIDDRMDDGLTEEEAVADIGTPQEIASLIFSELSLPKLVQARINERRALGPEVILLLILGAPLWIPLLLAAMAVLLSVYISLWPVVISLYAVSVSAAACSLAFLIYFFLFLLQSKFIEAAALLGFALICLGLGIGLFIAAHYAAKGLVHLVPGILKKMKTAFQKKEVNP